MGSELPFAGQQFRAGRFVLFLFPVPVVYVLTVGAAMGEPLLAFRALERLLAAVEPSVLGEVVFVFESLLTIGAFVGTQVCKREG